MEYCMAARALKSSLRSDMMKSSTTTTTQQFFFDDMFSNSNNTVVEDFSVDCFFDFSNGGEFKDSGSTAAFNNNVQEQQQQQQHMIDAVEEEEDDDDDEEEEEEKDSLSVSSQDRSGVDDDNNSNSSTFDESFLTSELAVPIEDLAELEWVSQFVDDSSPEFSLLYPLNSEDHHTRNRFQPEHPKPVALTKPSCLFPVKIPAKPRSKRTRPTGRTWSVESLLTDSSSSSSSYCSSSPISSSASTPCFVTVQTIDSLPSFCEPPAKKAKRKPAAQTGGATGLTQFQRRCSHCQVQKTPQWRTGPLGAKTLCNACGVRYKSGRLFPEYRPACSPTFSGDIHSNSHRKVLEIRKKKELSGPASGLSQMVPSF
ncbi:GATA transcription factor 5 [Ricinus communis]|uniref:GATA transcription factor n=1 Tax=Ricinus communis TaxID=3988 RepID=B9RHC6_RICCO|nr:GATA transcription factor 5 [Ricinus communis]EEF49488.1 GATA transcription factor, putative [Ricinus communis]|eukprot:XP_002512985.1 GATA transcription factor 5 [Ricinus communis]